MSEKMKMFIEPICQVFAKIAYREFLPTLFLAFITWDLLATTGIDNNLKIWAIIVFGFHSSVFTVSWIWQKVQVLK